MRRFWLLPCLITALLGADISGKWSGSIEVADQASGTTIHTPVRAEFQQKADQVSGTIGRREDQQAESIRNGRIAGKKVLFEVTSAETASAMKFDLTLEGDRMEGQMKGSVDTGQITGKVLLVREISQRATK